MTIIEAVKSGKPFKLPGWEDSDAIKFEKGGSFLNQNSGLHSFIDKESFISDKWELVKVKRKVELNDVSWFKRSGFVLPYGCRSDFTWDMISGKNTKLTIEWEE